MKLPKLTSKDMRYENKYGYDRLYSELTLTDTDWMNYKLTARFNTKYGRFFLSFEYFGADFSTLKATLQNESRTDTYTYEYSTDLFEKYIVRYLTDHGTRNRYCCTRRYRKIEISASEYESSGYETFSNSASGQYRRTRSRISCEI